MKTIYLKGTVGLDFNAETISEQISQNSSEKLRVIVNSPGGYVVDGFEIYNLFKQYKGEKEFVISPYAASAAGYFVLSGKVSAFKNSIWMGHKAWGLGFGDADEMRTEADVLEGIDNVMAEAFSERMNIPRDEIFKMMKNEIWLVGWEALTEAGIIDNVIDNVDDMELPEEISEEIKTGIDKAESLGEGFKNVAMMKYRQTKDKIRKDEAKMRESLNRAAAYMKNFSPENPDENNKITEEDGMTLQEFLEKNPDAKAEFDEAIHSAEAKGKSDARNDSELDIINAERKRICEILNYASVTSDELVIEALEGGLDAGEYTKKVVENQIKKKAEEKKQTFGSLKAPQTPAEQDESKKEITDQDIEAHAEKIASALDGIKGGI